ncbi:cell division protein FtsQ [Homoserinimonas aerilata]|uniref:Cell division protein FtsQ n=1 Tax=Homoserinimonas aerilata TaxID=1162970 RepID=A0A542YJ90_9MICO|nr:FtsQ-type POTRA domain-containing protein [Homoserinimonas aerilata]TQL48147.1 cell division protein FtsQ [Homoserinimonas aerilata]
MKRPEGFDRRATPTGAGLPDDAVGGKPVEGTPTKRRRPLQGIGARLRRSDAAKDASTPSKVKRSRRPVADDVDTDSIPVIGAPPSAASPAGARASGDPVPGASDRGGAKAAASEKSTLRAAQRQARRAAHERRRFEKLEVRRFTRRSRHRRLAWLSALVVTALLGGLIAVAVYSPLLALEEIEITGTSRISPDEVHAAVDGQLGTPLALLDYGALTDELSAFPLIRSYVTEAVPPHTLIIHIAERQPMASLMTASGYSLVDPAGVEIELSETRPAGVPLLELADPDAKGAAFESVVSVLLALPEPLLARVDRVTASTMDDVTLVFGGVGQRVVWGSVDRTPLKARVLEKLVALQDPNALVEYDVTAPLSAVVRPG